jgi:hypothetical protein
LEDFWQNITEFFKTYDVKTIAKLFKDLDWVKVGQNPLTWLAAAVFSAFVIWKKQFRLVLLLASIVAFMLLAQSSLPEAGQHMPLEKVVTFIGGSMAIVGVNLYFFFVRGH